MLDPQRYLDRIGISGPIQVTADDLARLQRAHMMAVPFENLDVRAGKPIILDEAAFVRKVVDDHRGGFCYELNTAFGWLLRGLGFEVALWSANVAGADGWGIDYDHMLLQVKLDEPWIADVGFGDSFLEPLRLVRDAEQQQGEQRYRLTFSEPYWCYERWSADASAFAPQFRFEPVARSLSDFAPGLAYHQSPASHFTQRTVVSRATPGGRRTLRADRLIVTEGGQRTELPVQSKGALPGPAMPDRDSPADWTTLLRTEFGISNPPVISKAAAAQRAERAESGGPALPDRDPVISKAAAAQRAERAESGGPVLPDRAPLIDG